VWCDTPYTSWNSEGEEWSLPRILERVEAESHIRHVVITGGEPLLSAELPSLTASLHASNRHITIETAGTIFQDVRCDLMSISPKLTNSIPHLREGGRWVQMHEGARLRLDVLQRLMGAFDYQMKFVVSDPADLQEIAQIAGALQVPTSRILLMPEGNDPETLAQRSLWLVEVCKGSGYRFCPRLHVMLYGNRRGV
jgi:7-carboxy-7-deazaguanine synthase